RGSDVNCTVDRHLLEAYLDGELGVERALEVETHLASCRVCSVEVQSWKDIRVSMQDSNLYYRAPAQLEERVRNLIPQKAPSKRTAWFQPWIWGGAGAAFATAVLLLAFAM